MFDVHAIKPQGLKVHVIPHVKLKTPWHEGTTHPVVTPLAFMQRLAARPIEERPSVE